MRRKIFNVYNSNNQAVQDAYAMLTANIHINNKYKTMKTFTILSVNPKEGKTSLEINLAVSMAQSGWKVLLVDADMRKPKAAKRLNDESMIGLSDYLTGEMRFESTLSQTNITNLTYLSCGSDHPNPIGLLCSARFEELMNIVKKEYDMVLFDTPALASVADGGLVAAKTDTTILVAKMGVTTVTALQRAKEHLESLNVSILGVVLNRVKKRDYKLYYGSYNYFFKPKRFFKKQFSNRDSALKEENQEDKEE